MWKVWAGLAGIVMALAIAVAAFAIPRLMFPDTHAVDAMTVRYTRTEALHLSKIPPLRLQLTSIEPSIAPQALAVNATLKWRTIFGVVYGTTVLDPNGAGQQWDIAAAYGTWMAFVIAEVLLMGLVAWCFWTNP